MKLIEVTFSELKDGDVFRMDDTIFGKIYNKSGDFGIIGDIGVKITPDYPVYIQRWPETINWQNPYTGEAVEMYSAGPGAYPYDCEAKDKHPDSIIYREYPDGSGAWIASHKLKEIKPGLYASVR